MSSYNNNNHTNTVVAILAGVALGAAAGILFAPDKGDKTRAKLKTGFDDKKHDLQDKYETLAERLKSKFAKSKKDLESSFDDLISNVDDKTEDVISTLERKLEDLKKSAASYKK